MAPNGIRHSQGTGAQTDWDVWCGSCLLNEIRLSASTAAAVITLDIYSAIVDSSGVIVAGGTNLGGAAIAERFRVSLATTPNSKMGANIGGMIDPFLASDAAAAAISAQVTGLRKMVPTQVITVALNTQQRMPFDGLSIPTGCIIVANIASFAGTAQVHADFVPLASGAFRKRSRGIRAGAASSGGASVLNDVLQNWTVNEFAGKDVLVVRGTGAGQNRTITSNTATQLATSAAWTVNPDATSTYEIRIGMLAGQYSPSVLA